MMSLAEGTDSSSVFQPDPPPAVEPLGRVREYHPLHCRTPWSRPSTSDAALARRVGAVQPATRDHAIRSPSAHDRGAETSGEHLAALGLPRSLNHSRRLSQESCSSCLSSTVS